jgi:hypothetical protein
MAGNESAARLSLRARPGLAFLALAVLASTAESAPQVWAQQLPGPGADRADAVVADGAGGTFETGTANGSLAGPSSGLLDVYVIHRSPTGSVIWQRQFGTSDSEGGHDLATDGAGGVFVAGYTAGDLAGPSAGLADIFVAHFDGSGNTLWIRQLGNSEQQVARGAWSDGAGGVVVCGFTLGSFLGTSAGDYDAWIVRFDAAGNQVWGSQFGTQDAEVCVGLSDDGAGGFYLSGYTTGSFGGPAQGDRDAWCARVDSAGSLVWVRQIGSPEQDEGDDVAGDGAGGCYLMGDTAGALGQGGGGGFDVFLARFDGAGNPIWIREFGTAASEAGGCVVADGASGVFMGGNSSGALTSATKGSQDVWIGHFGSDGSQLSLLQVGATSEDRVLGLAPAGGTAWVAVGFTRSSWFAPLLGFSDPWVARFEDCDFDASTNYCVGAISSTGEGVSIGEQGTRYLSNNDYALFFKACPANQLGIFITGQGTNNVPLGNGFLCVGGTVQRFLPPVSTGIAGTGSMALDFTDPSSPASQFTAGSTWNFQFWYRDPAAGGSGFNLSNGLSATFCP